MKVPLCLDLLPPTASTIGLENNLFFWCMVAFCGAITFAVAFLLVYFAIRYHRKRENELPTQIKGNTPVEIAWTVIPFIFFLAMFGFGAKLYFDVERPPDNALQVDIIAKQWMWKAQYPSGQREINALHVPVGRPVKLLMTSQDVIHSFYVPAFRVKQDVLPKRYTTIWFQATKPGKYHLFCAEYCGTKHSGMIGYVYAMDPRQYDVWLQTGAPEGSMAAEGEKMFHQFGCANCHNFNSQGHCPDLRNLFDRPVLIHGMGTVVADETYIRESILDPKAKIVEGFDNIMPTFQGQISEEQVLELIAYIRSMGPEPGTEQPSNPGSSPKTYGNQPGIAGPGTASSNSQTDTSVR